MQFPHLLFKTAGLNSTDVANLFGVSRVTGYRWLLGVGRSGEPGVGVNIFLRDRVTELSARLQRAIDDGALPNAELVKLSPALRIVEIESILNQYRDQK